MADGPKKPAPGAPAAPPHRPSIAEQTDIPSTVPMTPLVDDEDLGVFTPAALQRYQAQSGGGILLSPGDSGPAVEQLQRELRALGLLEDPLAEKPGSYGTDTEAAVRTFQEANGFVPTGKVDNRTRGMLREAARARGA